MKKQNQIEIPKYVLNGNKNIPEDLKKVLDYFRDCGNKNYQVCLVGEKESLAKDLKKNKFQGEGFIHLDNKGLNSIYGFLPISVKNAIRRINKLISNPDNDFNRTKLGIHTVGLVPIVEIESLNDLGYGLTSWNETYIYFIVSSTGPVIAGGTTGVAGQQSTAQTKWDENCSSQLEKKNVSSSDAASCCSRLYSKCASNGQDTSEQTKCIKKLASGVGSDLPKECPSATDITSLANLL